MEAFFCPPSFCQGSVLAKKLGAKKCGDLSCSFCPDHETTQVRGTSNSASMSTFMLSNLLAFGEECLFFSPFLFLSTTTSFTGYYILPARVVGSS